ncbi:hypothetical protein D9757_014277 [Collybiopsis confluens]|uniref:Uncharacterized protein n=1 Tax=Collybiopsis confluens TaxID=2823264 RepID=A0A8H5FR32_9AGAR|nr:hypothetical protein D9757_014277 [Collybiopsis confluens]
MSTCVAHHDWFTATLTFGLCCGLVLSYAPQHYRIIASGSSEGLSPVFLFLGVTSAASGMLNMFTMQWGIIKCCRFLSFGSCMEMTAGVMQVSLQWAMFTLIMVLYMLYYPPHLKYVDLELDYDESRPLRLAKSNEKTREWKLSMVVSWLAAAHLIIIAFTTGFLLATFPPSPSPSPSPSPEPIPTPSPDDSTMAHSVAQWATFLGVSSALLAAVQYIPQILHTFRHKVVGALSIPMMCIQTPGAVLMVLSIALRPGTNWTSWITFAVAGIMQGTLLVMCICWKIRQRRLGIDDFGNRTPDDPMAGSYLSTTSSLARSDSNRHPAEDLDVPGLVAENEDAAAIRVALANALESAVESDVRSGGIRQAREIPFHSLGEEDERTPLLSTAETAPRSNTRRWYGF